MFPLSALRKKEDGVRHIPVNIVEPDICSSVKPSLLLSKTCRIRMLTTVKVHLVHTGQNYPLRPPGKILGGGKNGKQYPNVNIGIL